MKRVHIRACMAAGFSMIEVLVTIVVVSVGLLGLSKMQAAAISNTQVSRVRSLVSLQAASLAAAMHGNTAYWAAGTAPASFTVTGSGVISNAGLNALTTDCSTTGCTPAQLAAFDLKQWGAVLNQKFPTYSSTINCTTAAGAPISCNINVSWQEKYVAINKSTAQGSAAQTSTQSYTLYVEP